MMIAPKNRILIALDLAQAESWVVAYLSESEEMLSALKSGTLHEKTARYVQNLAPDTVITKDQRYIGKKTNHAKAYREGPYKMAESINKEQLVSVTIKECKVWSKKWDELYNLYRWWGRIEDKARPTGDRTIITIYRRKRTFLGPGGMDLVKEMTAYEPQSTIADHTLGQIQPEVNIEGGLRAIYKQLCRPPSDIKIVNTAHDSVVLECDYPTYKEVAEQAIKLLRRPMIINGQTFTVPVDCEIGERWSENMEKFSIN